MTQRTPRVLALVGMPGSGKSVCAAHLKARGFFVYRFGSVIVDEVARRGWALTPENERRVREELRANEGMDAIARRALPILQAALRDHTSIVIDGLYSFSEYKLLRPTLGEDMILIAIFTERPLRYARLSTRPERPLTPAEAEARDYAELDNLEKGGPIALADYTLTNNGETSALLAALDDLIARLGIAP